MRADGDPRPGRRVARHLARARTRRRVALTLTLALVAPVGISTLGPERAVADSSTTTSSVEEFASVGGGYVGLVPARVLDTRTDGETVDGEFLGRGRLEERQAIELVVLGRGGVPLAGVGAVALNVAVTEPSRPSFLTVWRAGEPRPLAASLNMAAGQTIANSVIATVGVDGKVAIYNHSGATHVVVDVVGWFPAGPAFSGVVPARLLDTRVDGVTIDGRFVGGGPVQERQRLELEVLGRGGIPSAGVGAVALNVAVTEPSRSSFLTLWPAGGPRPLAASLNMATGQTIANAVIATVGVDGKVAIYNHSGATHVVVDVVGWFPAGTDYSGLMPARLLDTRVDGATVDGNFLGGGRLQERQTLQLTVLGRGGVPAAGVGAVALNVAVTEPSHSSFLTLWPSGGPRPLAASLNMAAGQTIANAVIATVGVDGKVAIYNHSGATHVVVDVVGWFPPGNPLAPTTMPAQPPNGVTTEDRPTTIVLRGMTRKAVSSLTFGLTTPANGAVALVGEPACERAATSPSRELTCSVSATYTPHANFFGTDSFLFTVSDGEATSVPSRVGIQITELNDPPVAGADSATTSIGVPLSLDVAGLLANDTPGPANETGQILTVTSVAGIEPHGTVSFAGGAIRYVPAAGFTGAATFVYTVCDNGTRNGQRDPKCADAVVTVLVNPINEPPVGRAMTLSAVEDTALALVLSGSDPDGDALLFAASTASNGTLSGTPPNLTYRPTPDFFGSDAFTFTVFDGLATSAPATVTVTVSEVNDPPIAGADSVVEQFGQPVVIPVQSLVANDLAGPPNESAQNLSVTSVAGGPDTHGTLSLAAGVITYTPDVGFAGPATFTYTLCDDGTTAGQPDPRCTNGTVTIGPNRPPVADTSSWTTVEDTPVAITLTGSDPDGDALTFTILGGSAGTLSGTAPDLVFTPAPDFFGTDTFLMTASDGKASSVPVVVTVVVSEVNDPPVLGADNLPVLGHHASAIPTASLLANDVPGPSNEATQTLAITAVDAGADTHGTVSLAQGTVTYIPEPGYVGLAVFTYTACDNGTTNGAPDPRCATGTVTLSVAAAPNAAPVATPETITAVEDTPLALPLNAGDADGDVLTFTITSAPAHGALSGAAPDLTYTPAADYFGPDEIRFRVFDGLVSSVPAVVTIMVSEVNDPPVAGNDAISVPAGQASTFAATTLLVNDVAGPTNEAGQLLTVTGVVGGADSHGTVSLAAGTITYTPDAGFQGTATFTYTLCDGGTTAGLADPRCTNGTVTVDVVPPDSPPVADAQSLTVAEDDTVDVTLTGSDPEGDTVTFAIATPPAHGTLSGTAPTLTYTPEADYFGPDSFEFTTNDGASNSAPATVSIVVTEVNDPPIIGTDPLTLGGGGGLPPPPPAPLCGDPCGVIYGDPHLLSFDKADYDAQAVGEVIAAKSTTDDFEVQARFAPVPGSRTVSIDTAVAMRVAGHRVTMYRTVTGMETRIDGTVVTPDPFPQPLPGGGTIGTYGLRDTVIVVWPDGSKVIARAVGVYPEFYRFTVEIGLAPGRMGNVVGILGDADGIDHDDLFTRAGVPVTYPSTPFAELYGTWVNSWRISQAESLFDYEPGKTTADFTDLTYPDAPPTLTPAQRAAATASCNLFGLEPAVLEACIIDVGITGDSDFATTAADAQEAGLGIPTNAGSAEFGTAQTVITTVADETAVRTFPAVAGQKLTLTVTGNTFNTDGADITIRRPDGGFVAGLFVTTESRFHDTFTLPAAGTYTITIDPRNDETGSLTFLLAGVPDNTGTTTIGTPTTITTTVIGENAVRTFSGTAGQKLTMTVSGNTYNTDGADFTVRQPNGAFVAGLFVSTDSRFHDVFTLPVTGTYTITVDPREQQTGTATFVLDPVPENTGTTTIGTPTTITTTVIGENAVLTFPGTAGQKLTMTVSGNTYITDGADFTIRQPNGAFVAGLFVSTDSRFHDVFTLPVTGTYTITVDPRELQTGTATFVLSPVPDNTGTTSIGTPTTITTTVIGENAVRTFDGTAGQKLTMTVSGNTYNSDGVDLTIRQPNGAFVEGLFVAAAGGFQDVFTLPVTGVYTLTVDPRDLQTGTVTFVLDPVPDNTGTITIGSPETVTTTVIGENATRTFAGTAGDQLTMTVSGNTYNTDGVDFTIRQPNGAFVEGLFVVAATGFQDTFTLPVTGTYTVTIDPRALQTGTVTFVLEPSAGFAPFAPASTFAVEETDPAEQAWLDRTFAAAPDGTATTSAASASIAAAAAPTLTITVAELLANDRPGPPNESGQTSMVTSVEAGPFTRGTVTFELGVVTYTPEEDFVGIATIAYTICDNGTTNGVADPRCTTGAISIKVTANHPPVVDPQTLTTAEGAPLALTLTGSDPDAEAITFVASQPGHGVLTGTAPALTYTPAPDFSGTDTFTFTANDGKDASTPATVTITVTEVNDPPVPVPDTIVERAGQQVTVPATTLTSNDDAGPFDESTQNLTVTAVTPGPDTHGAVSFVAGTITFTPDVGFTGTSVIGYTVCDDGTTAGAADPLCATSTLSITGNRAPTANDQSATTSLTKPLPIVLTAADPDGDTLTFAIVTPPAHGSLTGPAPDLTYTANVGYVGPDSFTFTAADAEGASAPATVSIVVNDIPSPTLGADSASVQAGKAIIIDVLANDSPGSGTLQPSTLAVTAIPAKGTAVVTTDGIRYSANDGTSGGDSFSYSVCDSGGGCASAVVAVTITENDAPSATDDTYDVAVGSGLNPAAPGVLGNDSDPDAGDVLHVRLVQGVTNGRLLLNSNGSFSYAPNAPGIDTFTYRVVDSAGTSSNVATVTIFVSGPPGPPIVGNELYEVEQGRELNVSGPGVLANDYSPNPRLALTVLLRRDAANGILLLQSDGSFVYTPQPGFTGIDQFSYTVRDAEGRTSAEGRVGITVTAGGPATATIGATSPAAGATILGPTQVNATLVPPAGETVTTWSVSYRRPGGSVVVPLANGAGNTVVAEFDPTLVRNGGYMLVFRAVTSGGGVLVHETGVSVEGEYKPGRYTTTFRDVAVNSANIPIDLFRTYDSTDKASGELGAGWSLDFGDFRIDTNGPLGGGGWSRFTCGSFPFLGTCYTSSKPHFVTVTWPDGHVERFTFQPNQGSSLVPTITTAGFTPEPGTTSTLEATDNGLLMSGSDFLLGNFFFADGIYDPIQFVLTDASGIRYLLDRRAGLLSMTDRNGNDVVLGSDGIDASSGIAMTFVRDAQNRITRIAAPGGNIDYTYSPAGDLVEVSYPNGKTQTYTYDAQHNLLTASGDGQLVRTVHYDASGRMTSITDGNGNTAALAHDVDGHQTVVTEGPLTTVMTFDDRGKPIQITRTAGGTTITTMATFDSLGRQLSSTDGLGHTTSRTYDAAGNVLTETDANGTTTTNTYDGFGQLLTTTDPLGNTTSYVYDSKGNLLSSSDGPGRTTTYTYDTDGNLLTTTDPVGRTSTRTYDAIGQIASLTDPLGNTTLQTVDPTTGLATSVTEPTGATTSYGYDEVGNLTRITDANGHTRTATYDAFDRLTSLIDHEGETVQMVYDGAGNLTSVTDRNAQVITYTYDAHGRLLTKNVPGAGITTYTYDAFGRLTAAANDVAHLTFTYDAADRVLTATSTPATPGALPTSTFTYSYDAAGNILSVQSPGGSTGYGYDADSQLVRITDPAGGHFDFGYDVTGLPSSMTRPNGITDAMSYNAAGDPISVRSTRGATLVGRADYAYDTPEQRASFTDLLGTTAYTYDAVSRLTSATPPAASGLPNETYTYDPVGNRISSATAPLGSFTYDTANRLLGDETYTYTYDDESNLRTRTHRTSGALTVYTWSAEHQLMAIAHPDGTTSTFRYDPLGRLVEIADGVGVTRYAYDHDTIAAEYDGANALRAVWVLPPDEQLPCPVEMIRDGVRYFYLADGLSSTTALTDLNGAIVTSSRYEAFGTEHTTGLLENPFRYLCLHVYGLAKLGFSPAGPYDAGSGQFLSDNPTEYPDPNPFNGPSPMQPPGGGSGDSGGGSGAGGQSSGGGAPCSAADGPQIYPKVWKKFGKMAKKFLKKGRPKHTGGKAGNEYAAVLPSQALIQEVADSGAVLRCQFTTAANALGP